ncbi:pogo transposable element with ZNF domain isoform X1 [Hippocampus zosterae]|uniref:pogo transposable element with ZNF domain isoform X1 n=1 Tax=Hippocampus zosterae TaxID=109293 RepID=UPI00223DEE25|nr:pogo transposable element with ZNF domain isoform X1 [Hippocampus zosterae]XP_051926998.1 pogo transposable element with ZNF domain isoform X1 [Hippocampus zosterae]
MAAPADLEMELEEEESMHDEDDMEDPPLNMTYIPVLPVNTCDTQELSGTCLGFSVNGRRVHLPPGGGATELKLYFCPGGSSSGFVTVRVADRTSVMPSRPLSDCAPVITSVVSGQAAHKVFKEHQKSAVTQKPLHSSSPKAPARPAVDTKKYIPKGPARPFKCAACSSQYKLISELRGFICLCSPVVAESVNKLKVIRKKKNDKKRQRVRARRACKELAELADHPPAPAVSSPRPILAAVVSTSETSPGPASHQVLRPVHGKLVIMVDDFYYGCDPGRSAVGERVNSRCLAGPYRCQHCSETLLSNIQLMSHLKTHAAKMAEEDCHMGSVSPCPHCFRRFSSPFKLQCHMEAVHTQHVSTAKCEICELDFGTEPLFLQHMKSTHKAGEMPYVCQVCDFRSSFYSDVWSHFEKFHANTRNLMCPYCLKVLRTSHCYIHHFARHQRKFVFSCQKCRLHFLCVKERQQHYDLHHRTHITPTQVTGLKLGTKVTVRTYSVVAGAKCEEAALRAVVACKVVDVEAATPPPEVPKKKPRESVAHLLSNLSSEEDEGDAPRPSRRCVECLKAIRKLSTHFPSRVCCSLCPFTTCCSTAYANHMIKDHTAVKKSLHYHGMFQSNARLPEKLICASCSFVSHVGDEMAAHLTEQPGHVCVVSDASDTLGADAQPTSNSDSKRRVTSSGGGGAFVPIVLAPPCQLSVKALVSPYDPPSPAAMTIKFLRPCPPPPQEPAPPSPPPPAPAPDPDPALMPAPRESHLLAEWEWRVATWALIRHEQQLRISEDVLLRTGARVPPENGHEAERYRRAVERLCRHLRPGCPGGRLPDKVLDMVMEKSAAFVLSLCSQIRSASLRPGRVGFMDELSVFVDAKLFAGRSAQAFQLQGWPTQTPLFDVMLSALSDGTFLPPVLFFHGAPVALPAGFPNNVLLEARRDGFSDARRLQVWTRQVWRPHVWLRGKSLLMADVHRGHTSDEFKGLLRAASTDAIFIPAGCSCRLQPLDVCVKPVLLNFLQARWKHLVTHGGLDGLSLDQLALMVACWLSEVSSTLTSDVDILRRSFASVCHLQKEQKDANQLIQSLTAKLSMPLEDPKPPPGPEPDPDPGPDPSPPSREVKLLLVLHRDQKQKMDLTAENGEHPKTS